MLMIDSDEPKLSADAPGRPSSADPGTVDDLGTSRSTGDSSPNAGASPNDLPAVPGYRVSRELARGGMGRVLAAFDLDLERDVAVKVLLPGANIDRFVREAKITARLPHPGIPPVYAMGTLADGSAFLAMKLVAGQTLAEEMQAADRPRLLLIFAQVCQAVGFAHSRGIVHRDLKPSNVMVGAFGEVQVMDWGLAKDLTARESSGETHVVAGTRLKTHQSPTGTIDYTPEPESTDDQTRAGTVLGTPAYMAPEQARGEALDSRADVFALGGILCAILTGKPPFAAKSSPEAIGRAAAADLTETHARLDECGADADVIALCRLCLSPKSADRPADGRVVADALTAHLNGVQDRLHAAEVARAAESARAEEATQRVKVERRARRVLVIAAGLLLLVLAGGVAGTSIGLYRAERAKDKAIAAEGETKKRADELQNVVAFQNKILELDPAEAGVKLMADLRARHAATLKKTELSDAERSARTAAFEHELHAVSAADAAVALLDRTVLTPAVRTIETQFADQPLVDASLRTTLGSVYMKLGRNEQGLALYQRALAIRKELLGEDDPDLLMARCGVGEALGELQRLDEAATILRETVTARERVLGVDHADTLVAKTLLALNLSRQGKYEESEAVSREILEQRRRVLGPEHADTLKTMKDLGGFLLERGKVADAEVMLREVVETQRRLGSPSVAHAMNNLAVALHRQQKPAAAEPLLREALERDRQELGEDHPRTIAALVNLASVQVDLGKPADAERLAKEALDKDRRILGNEHADTLKVLNVVGLTLDMQDKYAEAEPYWREALATGRRVLGEDHPDTIIWTANMGMLLSEMGRPAEAEPLLREALAKNRRRLGDTHPYSVQMTRNLVGLLLEQRRPAEAEALLRETLEKVRQAKKDGGANMIAIITSLGTALRDQGKLAEAEASYRDAMDRSHGIFGSDHANTLLAALRLASALARQGKNAETVALLIPIEGKVLKAFPGDVAQVRRASMLGSLGKARAGLAKQPADFATAEANLLEARSVVVKIRGENDPEVRDWTQTIANLYTAWDKVEPDKGHAAKAATWKEKLPPATSPPSK
jgi:serine/threonine protein kinase/Tfp pilus assembly protein PilF